MCTFPWFSSPVPYRPRRPRQLAAPLHHARHRVACRQASSSHPTSSTRGRSACRTREGRAAGHTGETHSPTTHRATRMSPGLGLADRRGPSVARRAGHRAPNPNLIHRLVQHPERPREPRLCAQVHSRALSPLLYRSRCRRRDLPGHDQQVAAGVPGGIEGEMGVVWRGLTGDDGPQSPTRPRPSSSGRSRPTDVGQPVSVLDRGEVLIPASSHGLLRRLAEGELYEHRYCPGGFPLCEEIQSARQTCGDDVEVGIP